MYLPRIFNFRHSFSRNRCLKRNYEVRHIEIKPSILNGVNVFHKCYYYPRLKVETLIIKRSFHVSKTNRALPPVIWLVLRSLLKIAAIITGRVVRRWWAKLPTNKRLSILNKIKRNKEKIMIGGVIFSGALYTYYITHLVEDPITKRKKFLIFSEKQVIQMAMIEYEEIMNNYKGRIIKSGYNYNKVLQVSQKILKANSHLPGTDRDWKVFIVVDSDTVNASVLPSGHIFIFTGMLRVVGNNDQLAAIIAHEIAHVLLNHSAEAESKRHLIEMLVLLPVVALWTVFPDSIAVFTHYVTELVSDVLFKLPFSRVCELEADKVGLEMICRACYNPQEAGLFWKNMQNVREDEPVEWLSTHPNNQTRYKMLNEFMPKALTIYARHCTGEYINPRP